MEKNSFITLAPVRTSLAKNIIIFIGDGMSLPTVSSARIYKAQREAALRGEKVNGEESLLTFETFPHAAFSKVIIIDKNMINQKFI
jgi:alkaline phosphatase